MRGNSHPTIRAIRGPVTLITIGVLFAFNNFTQYSFDRTWPVILIVFGLMSLLSRGIEPTGPANAPNVPPPPYSRPAAGGYSAPGGYSRSPYAGGPTATPGAPPPSGGPAATPGAPGAPPGGSV
jgi:hypothetical protein